MRIGFAGTPDFAGVALAALLQSAHSLPLVLTQPDRPAGRGLKLQASPVKQLALEHGAKVIQPRSLRLDGRFPDDAQAARDALQAADLDVLVVAAYGLILPSWALQLPRQGCLNIHGSLLPRWRGAAPIQRAIEAGDTQTGITIMQMDAGLDTGDMLLTQCVAITPEDCTTSLHDRLAPLGARLVMQALDLLGLGVLQGTRQPEEGVSYAHKIEKSEGAIDWCADAVVIERRIRAFDPFPGCTTLLGGQTVKVWRARVMPDSGEPGRVLAVDGRLLVACGSGSLQLLELQMPGSKRLPADEFLRRHPLQPG